MDTFDILSLWVGRSIICSLISFVLIICVYLLYSYVLQTTRFFSLMLRVNKFHNLKEQKILKLIWYVFFKNGLDLALMEDSSNWSGKYFYFSPKKMYVKGKISE
ncbi:MAG: hypothetical protein WC055_00845 [Melioribacteraceae bacterium]